MILRPGQEAVVLVRAGTVELTLRDRSEEYEADEAEEPLSVDISVRGRPFVSKMELPPVGDPRWAKLVGGETSFRPTVLACQILFTHVTRSVRDDPSPSNVYRWVADLRAALLKYEDLTAGELARVLARCERRCRPTPSARSKKPARPSRPARWSWSPATNRS